MYPCQNLVKFEFAKLGVDHYGRLLFHDLRIPSGVSIYALDSVFGAGHQALCTGIDASSLKQIRKKYKLKMGDVMGALEVPK